ncbi:hypothetical protein CONPUDRAFT_71959 [Coniophora puteana RWD-64-598 SS2]|uniref:Uncharacterized protein n=1 Tax=Coniophora puteana (strain RWD-64-598) TaxID=741705 RepID=A0A5M3MWP0_CONPW|nr:uncharacterized protein CONPUDRAFT_71959 [Coniophora puteana RWD-64-598 SS2]EIW83407.1 hypothetical protein CONPUDRAFT_71959 [Coniophora puteana RWD-64-598 SS2]
MRHTPKPWLCPTSNHIQHVGPTNALVLVEDRVCPTVGMDARWLLFFSILRRYRKSGAESRQPAAPISPPASWVQTPTSDLPLDEIGLRCAYPRRENTPCIDQRAGSPDCQHLESASAPNLSPTHIWTWRKPKIIPRCYRQPPGTLIVPYICGEATCAEFRTCPPVWLIVVPFFVLDLLRRRRAPQITFYQLSGGVGVLPDGGTTRWIRMDYTQMQPAAVLAKGLELSESSSTPRLSSSAHKTGQVHLYRWMRFGKLAFPPSIAEIDRCDSHNADLHTLAFLSRSAISALAAYRDPDPLPMPALASGWHPMAALARPGHDRGSPLHCSISLGPMNHPVARQHTRASVKIAFKRRRGSDRSSEGNVQARGTPTGAIRVGPATSTNYTNNTVQNANGTLQISPGRPAP